MPLPVRPRRRVDAIRARLALPLALGAAIAAVSGSIEAGAVDKNALPPVSQPPVSPVVPPQAPTALRALPAGYVACSAQPGGTFTTDDNTFGETVVECSLQAPTDGVIIATASGSMSLADAAYEAHARIEIDDAGGQQSDRWVNVDANAGDGTDKSIALTHYLPVTAGVRRITFKARRLAGGTVRIFDPTLTAIFVPASAAQTVCGSAAGDSFRTESATPVVVTSCQLDLTEHSTVFAFASGSMAYWLGPSEARVRLGANGSQAFASDRWVNVYEDDLDGTDESVATQYAFSLAPGTHSIELYASRYGGSGQVTMYDPVLTAIAVPDWAAAICSQQSGTPYTNPGSGPTVLRQCTLSTATPARALVFGSASIGMADPPGNSAYEGIFTLRLGDSPLSTTERWIDIGTDDGDGSDRTLAVQWGTELDPGTYDFALRGARYSGSGQVRAYNAAIHVLLMPSDRLFRADFELP